MPMPSSIPSLQSQLHADHMSTEKQARESAENTLAICGIGMRWPNDACTANKFQERLQRHQGHGSFMHQNGKRKENGNGNGFENFNGHARELAVEFDTAVFSMSEVEAKSSTSGQRTLLQSLYQCLEDAGETRYGDHDAHVGCYVSVDKLDGDSASSPGISGTASLISKAFGFGTIAFKEEESALNKAYEDIRAGVCRGALVACIRHVDDQRHEAATSTISAIYLKLFEAAKQGGLPIRALLKKTIAQSLPEQSQHRTLNGTHDKPSTVSDHIAVVSTTEFPRIDHDY